MKPTMILTLLFSLFSSLSMATLRASPETRLEKLSRSLRGLPASLEDRIQLKEALKNGTENIFFDEMTSNYLRTEQFEFKLTRKINELYRFKIDQRLLSEYDDKFFENQRSSYDVVERFKAHKSLIRKVVSQNLSWDELVLHKEYNFMSDDSSLSILSSEQSFFETLMKQNEQPRTLEQIILREKATYEMQPSNVTPLTYKFDPSDNRIAGLLTTPTFLERYVNTALNKNRKRAAAVFRILLCDPMVAAIPAKTEEAELKDLDLVFPSNNRDGVMTEDEIHKNVREADLHGSQPDCRACHEKLDPVGQVFAFAAAGLGPVASPGALSYRSRSGQKVMIPVSGVGELAQQLTKQPDYASCQVKHFWRWYVGQDIPLTAKRESELIQVFNSTHRRPKDFISYLVRSPEFEAKPRVPTENQRLFVRATAILKNCNSCHTQKDVTLMADWDLTDVPYSSNLKQRQLMIESLKEVLDTRNAGRNKSMPPKNSNWKLSPEDFKVLQRWLHSGAPDYHGQAQVAEEPL